MAAIVAIAGSIHLRNESALQELLGRHHYQDGSYSYVVDRDGKLIYHVDPSRLGEMSRTIPWSPPSSKASCAHAAC